jgi:hypothetical protein
LVIFFYKTKPNKNNHPPFIFNSFAVVKWMRKREWNGHDAWVTK